MATIVPPYVPVDGAVLDPDQLNRDWHSATDGESVYGELDGHLEDANFDAGMKIQPEHVRPGETFRYRTDGMRDTLDYFEDVFTPVSNADQDTPVTGLDPFIPVAGCGARVYLPYDCTCVLYTVSCFYTAFRIRQRDTGATDYSRSAPNIFIRMYVDGTSGSELNYTLRRHPITYIPIPNTTAAAGQAPPLPHEDMLTQHLDLTHLAVYNSADLADVNRTKAGWHEVNLRLYVAPNLGIESFVKPWKTSGGANANIDYYMHHRWRCGIRKANILALL